MLEDDQPQRLVILEFEGMERFRQFYDSAEYAPSSGCATRPPTRSSSSSKACRRRWRKTTWAGESSEKRRSRKPPGFWQEAFSEIASQ